MIKKTKPLTRQKRNQALVESGKVLVNAHGHKAFKFLGIQYSTNFNRKKDYSFDDRSWKIVDVSMFWKYKAIWSDVVHKLH